MTVSSSTNRVSYSGNGTLTTFAYTFKIFDEGDLTVILRAANGTETVQTITTHYTVTGAGSASGGNVEFVTAPSATETVVILREQDLTQGLDLVPNDPFPAQSLEESLDKLVFMVQQHEETLGRTIKASKTNEITGAEFTISAADRANKIFAFDGSGDVNITQAVGVYRGDWAASTSYAVRDIVKDTSNNNIYIANTAHTSSGSTPLSSNADIAKWDLLVDAASATASAAAAAASETAAETAQTAAEAAQTAAETAQTAAETAETNAETAETNAQTAQTAAEAAQTAAELAYDNFDDRYLGAKSSDPTLDNDGDALIDGALYFDTTNNVMKVYDLGGTAWKRTTPTSAEQTNIDTVSGISANVTTVAGISGDVTTVSGISSDVTTVAADGTDIGVVAGISANVTTVAGISSNVTTVAGISSDVTTVAADGTDIGTVATNIANVNTVAGISGNVTTVAGISADVTSVAADATDIGSVAGSISNVNTVATNLSNINTVAGISSNVTSVAGISSDVTTVANNLSDVSSFANLYRIAASDPTTSLDEGDLYYNTTNDEMKVYNGSAWQAVAPTATSVTVSQVSDLTATAAEINQLDGTADLPDIRPSLLLDFANSKTLDPRITFTRGSTATYWDGKTTAKAEENLNRRSQEFDHAHWSKGGLTVTADAISAPDGTTTADELEITTAGAYRGALAFIDAGPQLDYTWSVYIKKQNYDYIMVQAQARDASLSYLSNFGRRVINLSDGSSAGSDVGTCTTTDVGNGWYRVTVSGTTPSSTAKIYAEVGFTDSTGNANPTPAVAAGSAFYAWGAQLEQRSSATAYTATTSSPIVKYQPVLQTAASGEARFDHDPVTGESKGLLIEEARTNLYINSEAISSNPNINCAFDVDTKIAPDGSKTADKVIQTSTLGSHHVYRSFTASDATTYTGTVYAKAGELDYVFMYFEGNMITGDNRAWFNLSNGTIGTTNSTPASIEDVGNGWYRCSITRTTNTGNTACYLSIGVAAENGNFNETGDGYSGVYLWGAQVEEQTSNFRLNDAPSSYIPTAGSTVTRAQDHGFISQADAEEVYNPSDFTLYHESINANQYSEAVGISPTGNSILATFSTSQMGNDLYSSATSVSATNVGTDYVKAAVGVNLNSTEYTMAASGYVKTVTATKLPLETTGIRIGSRGSASTSFPMQGTIKKVAIYPKALSSATLQAMTEA